ncbi:hypothetical protein CNR37_00155 [Pseudomonas phage ventosus]|uniref:Uncharacterized protein n=1 Tax=Pseudomonas phage ventosus TaxID=2048980 RepID=A0A2H4P853_9CAUD|nr:hypothetical protein CNR37_00155 [Pseudomonas phage ventosus]
MNKALLDALTQMHVVNRNALCEELRLPGQHISEKNNAHAQRMLQSAEKSGIVRELEQAMREYQ